MSKTLALNNFIPGFFTKPKNLKFTVSKKNKAEISFYFAALMIVLNIFFLASYIYGVNNLASQGYEIKNLEAKISDHNAVIKDLNLKIAKATSMATIHSDFAQLNFVPAGTPKFLVEKSHLSLK